MRTSLLSKLLLGVAVLAAAQIVVESRAFAQAQLPAIGAWTNNLTLADGGAIQMATYNQEGKLVGGKIVDDTAATLDGQGAPLNAISRLQTTIAPKVVEAWGFGGWNVGTGFTDEAARLDVFSETNPNPNMGVGAIVNGTMFQDPAIDATQHYFPGHFTLAGKPADVGSILIAHTYYGDTQLKGYVNADDASNFLSGYLAGGKDPMGNAAGWAWGDFNYDGLVNADDSAMLLGGYLASAIGNPLFADELFTSPAPQSGGWVQSVGLPTVSQASAGSVSAVPEPGTFALLFAFGALVASRVYVLRAKKSVA